MKKLVITLEIVDEETVEEYWSTINELIYDDLRDGTLMKFCRMVDVKGVEG